MIFRNVIKMFAIVAPISLVLTQCVTPMSPMEVDQLTKCPKGVTLDKVRKNLLLAGYGIEHADADELVTDYRQGSGRQWNRVTAIQMDDIVKFKIRVRSESVQTVPTSSTTTVSTSRGNSRNRNNRQDRQITTEEHRSERVVNDYDQSYYEEYRNTYEQMKLEVCGSV